MLSARSSNVHQVTADFHATFADSSRRTFELHRVHDDRSTRSARFDSPPAEFPAKPPQPSALHAEESHRAAD